MQLNALLITFLAVFGLSVVVRSVLRRLNIHHLRRFGAVVPGVFRDSIDEGTLLRMRDYTVSLSRLGSVELVAGDGAALALILSGFLPWLTGTGMLTGLPPVAAGVLFFFACALILEAVEIPFDLYRTFVIEKRFAFSTTTFGLWLADLAKSLVLSGIILGTLLAIFLALIYRVPGLWWLLAWACFAAFQLVLTLAYPVAIAPLFNKFTPIEEGELKTRIRSLMDRAGLGFGGLFRMDASLRSTHSNAYFTGIGKTKRIVLFDTLMDTHTTDEITAVLAHELGHLKKGHVKKQLLLSMGLSLVGLYLAALFIAWPLPYETFGFTGVVSYAGLFLLALASKPFAFFLTPFGSMLSRRFERQADAYAYGLTGAAAPLAQALKRIAKDNLANLHPHPLYAWFYYSHPPLVERIEALEKAGNDAPQPSAA
ncbi:MAG: M48 family metallopeptidase [Syntrophaceae bacterium]